MNGSSLRSIGVSSNGGDKVISEAQERDVGSIWALLINTLDSHTKEMRFPRNALAHERAEGKERDFSFRGGLNTREPCAGIGCLRKQASGGPTRLIHIWKTLNGEARGVRVYTSSRDTSICFWERRKLAYTANKPKG